MVGQFKSTTEDEDIMCGIDCAMDPKGPMGECREWRVCQLCLIVKLEANPHTILKQNASHKPNVMFIVALLESRHTATLQLVG